MTDFPVSRLSSYLKYQFLSSDDLSKWSEQVIDCLDKIDSKPEDKFVHYDLGQLLGRMGQNMSAILCYNNALTKDAKFELALFERGNKHLALGHKEQALADYKEAITTAPQTSEGYAEAIKERPDRHTDYCDLAKSIKGEGSDNTVLGKAKEGSSLIGTHQLQEFLNSVDNKACIRAHHLDA